MGKYSKSGYKKKSEDRENPYNLINSNQITMKNVDFPVLGIDNLGNTKIMQPGAHYIFPGNEVFEVPLKTGNRQVAQEGTEVVGREGVRYNNPGVNDSHSTHVMAHEFVEGVGWIAFPTLFQVPTEEGGMEWVDLTKEKWIQEGNIPEEWNWGHAYEMAQKLGEVYEFGYGDEALKQAEEFAVDGYKNKQYGGSLLKAQKGNEINADMQIASMLQEAGYDTQLSDLRKYQGGYDDYSFANFAKAIGIYDNLYENKSRLNQFVRNIWPAIQFTFRQAAVMDLDGLPGGRNNWKSPWETDFVSWDEARPLLNEEYDIQNLVLDLTAVVFPAADVVHGFEQLGRGNYTNAALFMLFGIIPGSAGPLVDAIAPKLGALSDMAKGSPKTFRQNEEARKLAREIEKAIKESDKTGIKIDPNFKGPDLNPATVGKVFNIDNLPSQQPTNTTMLSGKKITKGNPDNKNWWYQTDESGNLLNKQKRFVKDQNLTSSWAPSGSAKINGELVNFEDFLTTATNDLRKLSDVKKSVPFIADGTITPMHYKNYVNDLNISGAEKRNLILKVDQHFADEPFNRQVSIFMDNNKEFGRLKEVARTSKNNPGELFVNKQQLKSYIVGDANIVPPASSNPYDQVLVNKAQTRTQEQKDYLLNVLEQNYGNLGKYDAISLNEFKDLSSGNMIDLKNKTYSSHTYENYGIPPLNYNYHDVKGKVIGVHSNKLTKQGDVFGNKYMMHNLDENTLGHFRIMEDARNPHVLNVLEQQSDWSTKTFKGAQAKIKKQYNEEANMFHNITEEINGQNVKVKYDLDKPGDREKLREVFVAGTKEDGTLLYSNKIKELEDIFLKYDQEIKSFNTSTSGPIGGQGVLIGKNYDRYGFQQSLRYALDNNKSVIRYPSVETSMKIQGHAGRFPDGMPTNIDDWIKTNPKPDPNRPFNEYIDMGSHAHDINNITSNIFSKNTVTIPPGMPGAGARISNPVISKKANNEIMDYGSMYGFKYNQTLRQRQLNTQRNWEVEITGEKGYNSGVVDTDLPYNTTKTRSSVELNGDRKILSENVMKKELTEKGYKKYKKIIDKEYNGNVEAFILDKSDEIRKANLDKYYKKLNTSPKKKVRREESIIASMHQHLDESYFINQINPKGMNHVNLKTISSGEMNDAYKQLKKGKTEYPIDFKLLSYDNLSDKGKEAYARYANYYDNIWFNEPANPGNWSLGPERQGHQALTNSKGQVIGSVPSTAGSDGPIHAVARKWQIEAQDQTMQEFNELFQINLYDVDNAGNLTYIDVNDYKNYQETLHKKNVDFNAQRYELDLDKRIQESKDWDKKVKSANKQLNKGDAPLAIMGDKDFGVHTTYQKSNFEKMVRESLGEDYVQYISQYTDEAGNTWNQLDLPEDVLSGKVEIRGMQTGGEVSEEDLNKFKNNAENNPAWLNNRLRTSVTPIGFENASEEMVYGKRKQNDKWDSLDKDTKNIHTDSWLKYLGYKQENQTFKTSNYRKDDDKEYVQFTNEDDIYNLAMSDKESDLEFNRSFDSKAGLPYISYSKSYNPNLPLIEKDAGTPYEIYGKMYYDPLTKDSKGSPIRISDDEVSSYAIKEDDMKAGLQHVESNDGEKEYDKDDSKAGRYGQQFDDVKDKYKGSKKDFSKDEKAQDDTFNARYSGTFSDEKGLEQSGYDLYQSNKDVADQLGYTPKEMAALSYLLGEEGAQRYLSNKLTGEKTVQELFPEMYKDKLKNTSLLPADYVESFKEGVRQYRQMQWDYILNLVSQYGEQDPEVQEVLNRFGSNNTEEKEKKGGEITKEKRKNNRLQQQLIKYKKGNSISPIAKRELKSMGLI
jgi:hypothetical protein